MYGRASVYMRSNVQYTLGNLIVIDTDHIPFGVSTYRRVAVEIADYHIEVFGLAFILYTRGRLAQEWRDRHHRERQPGQRESLRLTHLRRLYRPVFRIFLHAHGERSQHEL